jgi:hypothetical protein
VDNVPTIGTDICKNGFPDMETTYPFDETAVYSCMLTDWGPPPDDYWKS